MGPRIEVDKGPNETERLLYRTGYSTDRLGIHFNYVHIPRKILSPRPIKTEEQVVKELLEQLQRVNKLCPSPVEPLLRESEK